MLLNRAQCREKARECSELAAIATDPRLKAVLIEHAQEWTRLAYAADDEKFRDLVDDFNNDRLASPRSRRQPVQQPQGKVKESGDHSC